MTDHRPSVAILPAGRKLGVRPGATPLDTLTWPLGQPARLVGGTLGNLGCDDHLVIFPSRAAHWRPGFGTRARVTIMVMEPRAIHAHHMDRLRRTHRRFHRVLTCNEALLAAIPNGIFFPHGTTWVPDWRDLDLTKDRPLSLIASAKRSEEGHRLRHDIVDWARAEGIEMDVMGGGYRPFGAKSEGLARYRHSVVIENVRERNYFTEKLIDAVLCRTVPIYWGCPNIGDFLDTGGMILCETRAEVEAAIRAADPEDYAARLPALDAARERAAHWGDYERRAAEAVLAG